MQNKTKKTALRRLAIVRGQMQGLIGLVEKEKYCVDIITQSSAIKEALSGIERIILENHLSTHVIAQMKGGQEKKAIAEILKLYKLAQKKK
ncbi:MAG TPA: metal-sensing transcriptional repressor [Candidatus Paceibacterota bacterium]